MSEISKDKIEKGFAQLEQMLGSVRAQQIRSQWNQISTEFEQFVVGVLASELWTRSELDLRTRSLVTIAGLTALGRPRALALNIEMALNNGASRQEIRETILQMAFYAGFPASFSVSLRWGYISEKSDGPVVMNRVAVVIDCRPS